MCYNVSMGKKRRSYPKSPNRKIKIDFWPPSLTIYEDKIESDNATNTMKVDVKPNNPKKPTIKSNLKIDKE